ncbi:DEAD/DEAH box helicase [Thalassobacillus hwangdonensis]|uniref:DEAD/DEAH box helicase n=1 Tax=Thalassobacillus hwangdonensis TaxID=546108 RepID=A0ABW3L2K2_9BACI
MKLLQHFFSSEPIPPFDHTFQSPIISPEISSEFDPKLQQYLSGKLLLRHEIPLIDDQLNTYISKRLIQTIDAVSVRGSKAICLRCGNEKKHLFGVMPHASCNKDCLYCRKCIMMGRVNACTKLYYWAGPAPSTEYPDPCTWEGELTPFQNKAAQQLVEVIQKPGERLLVWAVCGAGKTEMLFPALTKAFESGKRVCLATPRADVVQELLPRFQASFPSVSVQALYGDSPDKTGDTSFILATTHQLLRYSQAFDVMIVDEVDAFPYHADNSLPYATNRATKTNGVQVYLTATPRPKQLQEIHSKKLPTVFVPQRFHGHPLPVPKLQSSFSLTKNLNNNKLSPEFYRWLDTRKKPNRQLLVFVPTIENASKIEKILQQKFNSVTSVHAADSNRSKKVQAFRMKEWLVLVTTTILERGVTFPSVDVAILDSGHTVFDQAALVQIAGRAGRSPDDPDGDVVFFHQGVTNAMVDAVESIKRMNRLASKL